MVKIGYLECPTGIAGDMCLGALVDCGLPWQYLVDRLNSLGIESEYQLRTERVLRNGQSATKVYVDLSQEQHHHHSARHLPEIQSLIENATLPDRVKQWSLNIFQQLAIAESTVHGIPPEKVHFHGSRRNRCHHRYCRHLYRLRLVEYRQAVLFPNANGGRYS